MYTKPRMEFPFSNSLRLTLKARIKNINRAAKRMVMLKLHIDGLVSRKPHVWRFVVKIDMKVVDFILSTFCSKGPEYCCDVLWPISYCMQ